MKKINWIEKSRGVFNGEVDGAVQFVLHESDGVWNLDGLASNKSIVLKEMLDYAQSSLNEYALGAAFSIGGGGQSIYPRGRFGMVNRGGFNTSIYGGSNNSMYTYDIVPLNRSLEQRVSSFDENPDAVQIYPGETVQGKELNRRGEKWIIGSLQKKVMGENGTILYFEVLDRESSTIKRLDPTSVSVFTKLHNSEKRTAMDVSALDEVEPKKISESLHDYVGNTDIIEEDPFVPSIFTHTIYRMPTDEELEEFGKFELDADEIIKGFSYTMIGRGRKNPTNRKLISDSIKRLTEMFPHNEDYKEAYVKFNMNKA
jgi:hypothetical protein